MANTRSTYGNVNNKSDFNVDEIIVKILNIGSIGTNFEAIISTKHLFSLLDVVKDVFMKQGVMLELEAPVKICGDVHGQYSDVLRLFDRDEVCRKYGPKVGAGLWNTFQYTFSCMPMTALVSGKILCMHGGISCKMKNLNQLRKIARPQLEVPNPSMEIDILWSDPDTTIDGFDDSTRGVGQVFGEAALKSVMSNLGVELVARAHQVVQDGYEFFCKKRLVTIFSAPHYCGEFDNAAAMMNVDKNLTCSFQIMRPVRKDVSKKDENN
ncbi:hypothetical protein L3Y34_001781 [Caenorhabditis briggsae]|uniref:Serine/threonine specific protein phosphatases domain-containing protein n=1 Tax=Caenorhabditis briggsae TaxID=6238 RepID=A0AAE9DD50_CAEBR|nr:hypothetical protein L3Y34_001781 [Caenorhabditis briggsae]